MTTFLVTLALMCGSFVLGYFVSAHPDDTRSFLTKVKAFVTNLVSKKP
jgi:hypothetical protein